MTVSSLENGTIPKADTQQKIRAALEPYVEFIEPIEGVRGAGIVMRWGVGPIGSDVGEDVKPRKESVLRRIANTLFSA